jgi:hypothetical protein
MGRFFVVLTVLGLALFFLVSCANDENSGVSTGSILAHLIGGSSSTNSEESWIEEALDFPNGVVTIRGIVSGSDFADLSQDFDVAAHAGVIENVPVGTSRKLTVKGLDGVGSCLYDDQKFGITVSSGETEDVGTLLMLGPCVSEL